jgi:hypothetical protein
LAPENKVTTALTYILTCSGGGSSGWLELLALVLQCGQRRRLSGRTAASHRWHQNMLNIWSPEGATTGLSLILQPPTEELLMLTPDSLKKSLRLTAICTAIAMLPLAAFAAGDAAKETTTAATHASLSAKADSLKMAHAHLHHTLNCLVGPKGHGYDAKAENPCKDMGDGAIPDTTDAANKKSLEHVAAQARAALRSESLETVQKDAAKINSELSAAG